MALVWKHLLPVAYKIDAHFYKLNYLDIETYLNHWEFDQEVVNNVVLVRHLFLLLAVIILECQEADVLQV